MHLDSLAPARARAASRLLEQYLIGCPGCGKAAAVHADRPVDGEPSRPTIVRVVCPVGCVVAAADVLALLPDARTAAALSA